MSYFDMFERCSAVAGGVAAVSCQLSVLKYAVSISSTIKFGLLCCCFFFLFVYVMLGSVVLDWNV